MSMKHVAAIALSVLAVGCASNPKRDLGRLAFMVGCWQSADRVNLEVWSAPEGGIMFGYATTTRNGTMSTWEQSRIDLRQGYGAYTASPEGQRPVTFAERPALPSAGAPVSATFENANHDYPQRITYQQTKTGLAATISKLDGTRPFTYEWERCKY